MVVCVRVFSHHNNFLNGERGTELSVFFYLKELISCYIILASVDLLPMIMKKLRTHRTYLRRDADL